ncbi:RcnB family protein, partial [Xanthomonas hortorum]|uniref:RcnB family protein n=1 Tax=Xanthomonas hortorum TaxID=56454 RepID=UPI0039838079
FTQTRTPSDPHRCPTTRSRRPRGGHTRGVDRANTGIKGGGDNNRNARGGWGEDPQAARRDWRQDRRYYGNGYREGYRDARYRDRHYDRGGYAYVPAPVYYGRPAYVRGHRYQGPIYVVNDYDRYNLRYPPRGYRWQRDNTGNFLMVAIATGVIADLVLNN